MEKKLLLKKGSEIIDIGSGKGLRIIDLINDLKIPKKKIIFKKNLTSEITNSIADLKKLYNNIQ